MKYLLKPLDPEFPDLWFDTNSVYDLARLGGWDEDVVYVAGNAYHAPAEEKRPASPTGPTPAYIRELKAELLATTAERNALRDKLNSLAALIQGIADDDIDCPFCLVVGDTDHLPNCLVNVARAAAKGTES